MRYLLLALTAAAALQLSTRADDAPLNQLTAEESAGGWKLLFDGKDAAAQWRGYKKEKLPEGWIVDNGELVRQGGGGDIVTKEEYDSFELSLEWKISEGGNSGVIFKVKEDAPGASYTTGPEAQVQDNVKGHDPQKAGWLYQLYPSSVDTTKPVGEWNHFVLQCQKTPSGTYQCEHWLNETKYCTYEIGSDDWKEKVAKSKFKDMPAFGKAAAGHICLQDHGNVVGYRNIKIKVLP